MCRYDNPRDWRHGETDIRNMAIVETRQSGATIPAIAAEFRVSPRTVHRILAHPSMDQGDGPAETSLKAYAGRSWVKQRQPWPKMPTPTGKSNVVRKTAIR